MDNGQVGQMDFRLYNGGAHDLSVRFARVIKLENPLLGLKSGAPNSSRYTQLFPNPVSDILRVKAAGDGPMQISLLDVYGRTLSTWDVNNELWETDMSALIPGVYWLLVSSEKEGWTEWHRLVKH